jgi:hypothetical protein
MVTTIDRNHLRSAMNLRVALVYAIKKFWVALALGRLGTCSFESHFGIIRSALRGQGQWLLWCKAQAFAALLREMKLRLGLASRHRAGRAGNAGATITWKDAQYRLWRRVWSEPGSGERDLFLRRAKAAVSGDKGAIEVMWDYTWAFVEHLAKHPIRLGSLPSPRRHHGRGPLLPPGCCHRPRVNS